MPTKIGLLRVLEPSIRDRREAALVEEPVGRVVPDVEVVGLERERGSGEVVRPGPEIAVRVPLGVRPEQRSGGREHRERKERGQDPEDEQDDPSRIPTGTWRAEAAGLVRSRPRP